MDIITAEQDESLLQNGVIFLEDDEFDPEPVVKLFDPHGPGVWLLTSRAVGKDYGIYSGLADIGFGCVEWGYFALKDLPSGVKRDPAFRAKGPMSLYLSEGLETGQLGA